MKKYHKVDSSIGIFCARWTYQTRCCYLHKMDCSKCSCRIVCDKIDTKNEYGIKPVKYATLLTYAKLGAPKGGIMTSYDSWLSKQADAYWEPCEPEMDRYGEYTKCIECFDKCDQYYEIFGEENDTRDK